MDNHDPAALIDSSEAQRILRISRATLNRWIVRGIIETSGKYGGAWVFRRGHIESVRDSLRQKAEDYWE
jgi:predicted site-specific integrase-resolvase